MLHGVKRQQVYRYASHEFASTVVASGLSRVHRSNRVAGSRCQHEEAKLESKQAPRQDLVSPPCRSEASGKSPDAWRAGALGTGQR